MSNRLTQIVVAARAAVEERKRELAPAELAARIDARGPERPFRDALERPGISLIAEFKRRSPSSGDIRPGATVSEVARAYERGGAAALSVLTDGTNFGGSLDDLREARAAVGLPILRKDFIVDRYQLHEAAAAGADAVLLIVAALADGELSELDAEAAELGLDRLVEVHDAAELERAAGLGAGIIGINNRDLTDLTVDTATSLRLLGDLPEGTVAVAESGYEHRAQLDELERAGADAVLIGESLMRRPDPGEAAALLVG